MRFWIRNTILIAFCGFQLNCTGNVLTGLASTTTDEALLNDARTALNNLDFQIAIDIITTQLSADGQQKAIAKELLAGGYAGKCGLNFLDFILSMTGATSGNAFVLVKTPFVGKSVDPASCLLALNTIQSIGAVGSRTLSENIFAAIAAMSLMGTATRLYTDNVPDGGNGSQDAAGISCTLTDAQVDYVILGFGFMVENFSSLSSSQLGSNSTAFTDIMTMCATVGGTTCNITSASSITNPLRTAFRKLLNTTEYGVGTVVTSNNPALIATACP